MTDSSNPAAGPGPAPVTVEDLAAHLAWARRLATGLIHDRHQASDAVQEAWIAGWKKPPAGDRPLRPWLGTVLMNGLRNRARADRRRGRREQVAYELGAPDPVPTPEELTARLELQRQLAERFLKLPEICRQVMYLSFYEGLDSTTIGLRLSLPPGTVRWRLKAGLDQLRAELDGAHGGERKRWMRLLVPLAAAARRRRPLLFRPLVLVPVVVALVVGLAGFFEYRRRTGLLTRAHLTQVAQLAEVAPRLPPPSEPPPAAAAAAAASPPAGAACPEAGALREETSRLRAELDPHIHADTILASATPNPALERRFGALISASLDEVGKCGHRLECRGDACRLTLLAPISLRHTDLCFDDDFRNRIRDYVGSRTTTGSPKPVWDPLSGLPLKRIELRFRMVDPDATPVPFASQPRRQPPTILRHQIRPPIAASATPECQEAYRQALAERAALEKIADRDVQAQAAFPTNGRNPEGTAEARRIVQKVLGADLAARLDVECRGPICRVSPRAADDPLTAFRWSCDTRGWCQPAPGDEVWFRRLAVDGDARRFWGLEGEPLKTPRGEMEPHYRLLPVEDRNKPTGMSVLRKFADELRSSGMLKTCEGRFPAKGRVAFSLRLTAPDDQGRSHIEIHRGGELGGSPLAGCITRAIEDARATFEIPAHAGGAVIHADLEFPGGRQVRR